MLNEVPIFDASVFNSELDSNFINSKLVSHNLSQGINFTARLYDLVCHGVVLPLVGGLLAVLFHLYSATDTSTVPLITQ